MEADVLLPLSGLQHMAFCPRQWALIHVESQWQESLRTAEGRFLHKRADNPFILENSNDKVVSRSVQLISQALGFQGVADVVEFHRNEKGIELNDKPGLWQPIPVEYKRGHHKPDERDEVQLCAQAICLEEMLSVNISYGQLFYWENRRRETVLLTDNLREITKNLALEMHHLWEKKLTPPAPKKRRCSLCSLKEICLAKLTKKRRSINNYWSDYQE